jgi:hypothetical protein
MNVDSQQQNNNIQASQIDFNISTHARQSEQAHNDLGIVSQNSGDRKDIVYTKKFSSDNKILMWDLRFLRQ